MANQLFVTSLKAWLHGQVHPSVVQDQSSAYRHMSFIASHTLGAGVAFALMPLGLVWSAMPGLLGAGLLSAIAALFLCGLFVSRTGRLQQGILASSAVLLGLALWGGALLGPLSLLLLLMTPLEAMLTGTRRTVALTFLMTALTVLVSASGVAGGNGVLSVDLSGQAGAVFILALLGYLGSIYLRLELARQAPAEDRDEDGETLALLKTHMTDLITRHDQRGDVVFATDVSDKLLGLVPSSLFGNGFFNAVHVADRPAYLKAVSDAMTAGEAVLVECRMLKHHGDQVRPTYIWTEMRCMSEQGQDAPSVIVATRDISVRKAHEDALVGAKEAANAASVSNMQFLANMSHELRTPLNAVIGFADILKQELFGPLTPPRYKDYATLIHESGEHLLELVNALLDVSRIEAGKFPIVPEPFDATTLVEGSCKLMAPAADDKQINLVMQMEAGLPEMVADPRACKQMVLNLLSNAVKFSPDGAEIRVQTKQIGRFIEISVKDHGPGIAAEDLPKLGQPFFQCDDSYERRQDGSGLGLSVVRGLAELHKGQLEIASTVGIGTTATLRLPVDCSDAEAVIEELQQKAVSLDRHIVSSPRRRAGGQG
ncbi:sensor histidine kinase [Coralliovum pocilloporae]|uniref:sensor histidine kinase n=1 Tax=Coralliovum pocilloporae TaxID=3066369 RepID=UPI0033077A85